MMKSQLKQRLQELKAEFEAGQKMLAELDAKRADTKDTLLRISGAIQVLEELLNQAPVEHQNGKVPDPAVVPTATTG
jgi:predicted nuclease with TOPRIM domain